MPLGTGTLTLGRMSMVLGMMKGGGAAEDKRLMTELLRGVEKRGREGVTTEHNVAG